MTKYMILCGGTEKRMPEGYSDELWVYLGILTVRDDTPVKELPELLYKHKKKNGYHLEAEEIKNTADRADKIKIIEVSSEYEYRRDEIHYMKR